MKDKKESGSITINILLILMFIVIAVLIYILAGGQMPKVGRNSGIQSPEILNQKLDTPTKANEFSDGLNNPVFSEQYKLDEFGAGISERDIFDIDINKDGQRDRITRTRNENGTSHFYYQYKIELNRNGNFVDITPDDFRTTEGAECALQKLQFKFAPEFQVTKISRDWQDSWNTPTMATKTVYLFNNGKLEVSESYPVKSVCSVTDLF